MGLYKSGILLWC